MNNNYQIHCSIDCKDGKTHRLSYEIASSNILTEGMSEICAVFNAIEQRFPGVRFWVTEGSEFKYKSSKENEEPLAHNDKTFVENSIQTEIQSENSETN